MAAVRWRLGLDGRQRRPERPLPCEAVPIEELPAGLLVYGPSRDGGDPWSVLVTADGAVHRLPWPSSLDGHVMGLIGGHPDGRLAHVAFYPALDDAEQMLDVWLLDTTTRRWRRLPDMPLRLAPSKPELRWTDDGRLLLLAGHADELAGVVAVWRPGEPRVALRQVPLPASERHDGFRFAVW